MKFRKNKIVEVEELDITSLLDILVILLVFLLQSFNSSDLTINLAEQLALPYSDSAIYGRHGPILQVNNKQELWLDDVNIGRLNEVIGSSNKLGNLLKGKAEELKKALPAESKGEEVFFINLLFDKELNYTVIDQVLKKCAESGFGKYKFIVQSDK